MRLKDLLKGKRMRRHAADEDSQAAQQRAGATSKGNTDEASLYNTPPSPSPAAAAAAAGADPSTVPTVDTSATSLITHTGESVNTSVSNNIQGVTADHPAFHRVDALPHVSSDTGQIIPGSKMSDKASTLSSEGVPGKLVTLLPDTAQQQQQQRKWNSDQGVLQQQQQHMEESEPRTKLGLARPLLSGDAKNAAEAAAAAAAAHEATLPAAAGGDAGVATQVGHRAAPAAAGGTAPVTAEQRSSAATAAAGLTEIEVAAVPGNDEGNEQQLRQLLQTTAPAAPPPTAAGRGGGRLPGNRGMPVGAPHTAITGSSSSSSGTAYGFKGAVAPSKNTTISQQQQQRRAGQRQEQSVMLEDSSSSSWYTRALNSLNGFVCGAAATAGSLLLPLQEKVEAVTAGQPGGSSSSSRGLSGLAGAPRQHEPLTQTMRQLPQRTARTLDMTAAHFVIWITGSLIWGINQSMSVINSLQLPEAAAAGSSSSSRGVHQAQVGQIIKTLPSRTAATVQLMASQIMIWITRSLITVIDLAPVWVQEIFQAFPGWVAAVAAAAVSLMSSALELLGDGEESTRILDESLSATHSLLSRDWSSRRDSNLNAAAASSSAAAAVAEQPELTLEESLVVAHDNDGNEWVVVDPASNDAAPAAGAMPMATEADHARPGTFAAATAASNPASDTTAAAAAANDEGPEAVEPSVSENSWELVKQAVPASSSSRRKGLPVTPHPSPNPSLMLPPAAAAAPAAAVKLPLSMVAEHDPSTTAAAAAAAGIAVTGDTGRRGEFYPEVPAVDAYRDEHSNNGSSSSGSSSSSPVTPRPTPSTSMSAAGAAPIHAKQQLYQQQLRDAMAAAATQQQQSASTQSSSSSSCSHQPQAMMAVGGQQGPEAVMPHQQQQQQQGFSGGLPRCNTRLPEEKAAAAAITAAAAMSKDVMQELVWLQQQQQSGGHWRAGSSKYPEQQQQQRLVVAPAAAAAPGGDEMFAAVAPSNMPDDVQPSNDAHVPAQAAAAAGCRASLPESMDSLESVGHAQGTHHTHQQQQQQKGLLPHQQQQQQQGAETPVGVLLQQAQQETSRLMVMLSSSSSGGHDGDGGGGGSQGSQPHWR